jgi:hypothetical protein
MKGRVSKKHRSHKRRSSRGGYTSAASYEQSILGNQNQQYGRVFDIGGPNNSQSNAIMANESSGSLGYLPYQRAGRKSRRRKSSRRHKRGGFLGNVLNQAIVPFGLVGLNQYYGKKSGSKTRKMRRH